MTAHVSLPSLKDFTPVVSIHLVTSTSALSRKDFETVPQRILAKPISSVITPEQAIRRPRRHVAVSTISLRRSRGRSALERFVSSLHMMLRNAEDESMELRRGVVLTREPHDRPAWYFQNARRCPSFMLYTLATGPGSTVAVL